MTNFIHATGSKEPLKLEHQDRRFEVVRKPIAIRALDLPQICDICHRRRNQGNHARCSQRRQKLNRERLQ